ncbi:SDR family oxidoreductase [Microbacterium pseudoresistens]|uniref:Uncharacterized protein YbjT (DUF2867 family) n=1 Tax=Microbacterium pseudoresistens TaxID=640634 RepID=A0A7Y9EXB6_9MICO|nr:NmrA family NAD(P)-binding protein [Microbacterium pseudoresistens]NYD55561.1 uncharacterized protein YbjT (DUF2867 family) [Microbacterium pseudoresistens]
MTRIVVVGGTGRIGTRVVDLLRAEGKTVAVASRATGVDLVRGDGLRDVISGADVVIDVSKTDSTDPHEVSEFFSRAGENLASAERAAGVGHHIMLSIVGTSRATAVPFYAAKAGLERAVTMSGVPYTILQATQFFEFADGIALSGFDPHTDTVRLPPVLVQPIAGADVAAALAVLASAPPRMGESELAGPEKFELDDFVRIVLDRGGRRHEIVRDPDGRYFGGLLDRDALLPGADARLAPTRLADWLSSGA